MTDAQRNMLFRMFSVACRLQGIVGSTAREIERENLTVKALGRPMSWTKFGDPEVDDVKGELLAIIKPVDLDAQLRQIQMRRSRLLYAIERLADAPYIAKIARDKFGCDDLTRLNQSRLNDLRITLIMRKRAKDRKAKQEQPVEEVPF
jgi:hypothetical protein